MLLLVSNISTIENIAYGSTGKDKLPPGTYSVSNILAFDTNLHPTNFDEAEKQFNDGLETNGRTGISMFSRFCMGNGAWSRKTEKNTDNSGRDRFYTPDSQRSGDFIWAIEYKYPGQEKLIIDYMNENGILLSVDREQEISRENYSNETFFKKADDNTGPVSQSQCEPGDEMLYYNNLDFWLKFEFTVPELDCTDPEVAAENPEECEPVQDCSDPIYAAENPVECPPPPLDCTDPLYADNNKEECNPPPPVIENDKNM